MKMKKLKKNSCKLYAYMWILWIEMQNCLSRQSTQLLAWKERAWVWWLGENLLVHRRHWTLADGKYSMVAINFRDGRRIFSFVSLVPPYSSIFHSVGSKEFWSAFKSQKLFRPFEWRFSFCFELVDCVANFLNGFGILWIDCIFFPLVSKSNEMQGKKMDFTSNDWVGKMEVELEWGRLWNACKNRGIWIASELFWKYWNGAIKCPSWKLEFLIHWKLV